MMKQVFFAKCRRFFFILSNMQSYFPMMVLPFSILSIKTLPLAFEKTLPKSVVSWQNCLCVYRLLFTGLNVSQIMNARLIHSYLSLQKFISFTFVECQIVPPEIHSQLSTNKYLNLFRERTQEEEIFTCINRNRVRI